MIQKTFYATDFHGSKICFRKFINAAKVYKVSSLILGGDLTGKRVIPIIEQPDGIFKCQLFGRERKAKKPDELENLIKNSGFYAYHTTSQEMKELEADTAKINALFMRLMKETVVRWIQIAEERLEGTDVKLYVTGGNDDPIEIDDVLKSSCMHSANIIQAEGKVVNIDNSHEMISDGHSNITPWKCPRDIPEEELSERIETMISQVRNLNNCIFNFHCPPYDTGIDLAPELDDSLKPILRGGRMSIIPVGSTAVRDAIQRFQPMLGLHGHIHESGGVFKLGRTICVNPGSEYSEGILRGVIISMDEKGIKNYLFVSG